MFLAAGKKTQLKHCQISGIRKVLNVGGSSEGRVSCRDSYKKQHYRSEIRGVWLCSGYRET